MSSRQVVAALVAAAGMAMPVFAQDSVSGTPGLANVDSLDVYNPGQQLGLYVVDLQQITTSRGNTFGIAPLMKGSRNSAANTTMLLSHNVVSSRTIQRPAPHQGYSLWTGPGFGINTGNPAINLPGTPVSPGGTTYQLAAAVSEFGTTDAGRTTNSIVGTVINYTASEPDRLYVSRQAVGVNGENGSLDFSKLGLGFVDAAGNVLFRADSNQSPAGARRLQNQNIFRVRMLGDGALAGRSGGLNVIDNDIDAGSPNADLAATDWILRRDTETHSVPSAVARESGARSVYYGANFANQIRYEDAVGSTVTTTSHWTNCLGYNATRSSASASHAAFFPNSVATGGMYIRRPVPTVLSNSEALPTIGVWGVGPNGSVVGTRKFDLPTSISDRGLSAGTFTHQVDLAQVHNDDPEYGGDVLDSFDHHRGSTAFSGGPAVGVGMDQAGRLLASGVLYVGRVGPMYQGGSSVLANWPYNAIVVARAEPGTTDCTPTTPNDWALAAYVLPNPDFNPADPNPNNRNPVRGKPFENAAGQIIGELRPFNEMGIGALGPSMSAGAFDSVGNVWFLASYDRYDQDGFLRGQPTTGLFRAIYNPGNFSYRLELVLNNGAEIRGRNSDRDYKITFLSIANSSGGVSPGTLWANSVNQSPWGAAALAGLNPEDPRSLGGLTIQANIIYDVNQDEAFESLTGAGGNPNSPDQNYQVILFLGGAAGGGEPADCNGNGIPDDQEIAGNPALDCFNPAVMQNPNVVGGPDGILDACQCPGNWDRNNAVNSTDISGFITSWLFSVNNGSTGADVDCSGTVNSTDISTFITRWLAAVNNPPSYFNCP